jgi:hypothetical protein
MEREAASPSSMSSSPPTTSNETDEDYIVRGDDGIYQIENELQHQVFLEDNKDKLVIMKVRYSVPSMDYGELSNRVLGDNR